MNVHERVRGAKCARPGCRQVAGLGFFCVYCSDAILGPLEKESGECGQLLFSVKTTKPFRHAMSVVVGGRQARLTAVRKQEKDSSVFLEMDILVDGLPSTVTFSYREILDALMKEEGEVLSRV